MHHMQRFTREALETDPWAGTFVSAGEESIATDGEDGLEMQKNQRLKSFAKAPGGVWVSPCKGDLALPDTHLSSLIPALSRAGYTKGDNSQN